jgi:hypothetical protein
MKPLLITTAIIITAGVVAAAYPVGVALWRNRNG